MYFRTRRGYIPRRPCPRVRPSVHTIQRARGEIFKLSLLLQMPAAFAPLGQGCRFAGPLAAAPGVAKSRSHCKAEGCRAAGLTRIGQSSLRASWPHAQAGRKLLAQLVPVNAAPQATGLLVMVLLSCRAAP